MSFIVKDPAERGMILSPNTSANGTSTYVRRIAAVTAEIRTQDGLLGMFRRFHFFAVSFQPKRPNDTSAMSLSFTHLFTREIFD